MFRKTSNIHFKPKGRYKMVSRQVKTPFCRTFDIQHWPGFGLLAHISGRTVISILRKNMVLAAKRVHADFLEFAAPDIAKVVRGRKKLKAAAKSVGRETLENRLNSGRRKKDCKQCQPSKICKTNQSVAKSQFYKHFALMMRSNFPSKIFLADTENRARKVLVCWQYLVVPRTRNLSHNLTQCKLHKIQPSKGQELLGWFDTHKLGYEIENCQGLRLRNLQYQRSKKRAQSRDKNGWGKVAVEEKQEAPKPLVTHLNNILNSSCTSTICKDTTLTDCMRTSLTKGTSNGSSLSSWEFFTARGRTMKKFLMK